jgi:hypothetical protein
VETLRFIDATEVHHYVGSIFRLAGDHPVVGPRLAVAASTLRIVLSDPDCELTVGFDGTHRIDLGPSDTRPDVTLAMSAEALDGYWRGEYDLLRGLACGDVLAHGQVSRVLKVLPDAEVLFPVYRALTRTGRTRSVNTVPAESATAPGSARRSEEP